MSNATTHYQPAVRLLSPDGSPAGPEVHSDEVTISIVNMAIHGAPRVVDALRAVGDPLGVDGQFESLLLLGAEVQDAIDTTAATARIGAAVDRIDRITADSSAAINEGLRHVAAQADDLVRRALDAAVAAPDSPISRLLSSLDSDNARGLAHELGDVVAASVGRQLDGRLDTQGRVVEVWREEVRRQVGEAMESVERHVAEVSARIATIETGRGVKTAADGLRHEQRIADAVNDLLKGNRGESARVVGSEFGDAGTKRGDVLVGLQVAGRTFRVIIEAKDRKLPLPQTLREAAAAKENHSADAVMVGFASCEQIPAGQPLMLWGDESATIGFVLDRDDPDTTALAVAIGAMRLELARRVAADATPDTALTAARVAEATRAVDRARECLRKLGPVKGRLTTISDSAGVARTVIDEVQKQTVQHLEDVVEVLAPNDDPATA